jgi:hypothetical protein
MDIAEIFHVHSQIPRKDGISNTVVFTLIVSIQICHYIFSLINDNALKQRDINFEFYTSISPAHNFIKHVNFVYYSSEKNHVVKYGLPLSRQRFVICSRAEEQIYYNIKNGATGARCFPLGECHFGVETRFHLLSGGFSLSHMRA